MKGVKRGLKTQWQSLGFAGTHSFFYVGCNLLNLQKVYDIIFSFTKLRSRKGFPYILYSSLIIHEEKVLFSTV